MGFSTKIQGADIQLPEKQIDLDREMVRRSIELAALGVGRVSPNPLVGCVIVSATGDVVGEGTYLRENVTHAEALALAKAGEMARGGTAYVSLEPHAHHGRTAPCTKALIDAGIRRVVAPIEDPNPLVSGKGFAELRSHGVEVTIGIMSDEAQRLNEKFICWHQQKRPFVHLKLAMSLDGRISLNASVSTHLSGTEGRARVQAIRHEHDAILVGGNTAFVDNPALTDRSGRPRRRPLLRVVLDNRLQIEPASQLVTSSKETPTLIFTNSLDAEKVGELRKEGAEVVESEMGGRDLKGVLKELYDREVQSLLVEGGTEIAGSFVDAGLVDKITFIISPIVIGGREAPNAIGGMGALTLGETTRLERLSVSRYGEDIEITGYPERTENR